MSDPDRPDADTLFGAHLRELRLAAGLGFRQFADLCDIKATELQGIVKGHPAYRMSDTLIACMAYHLGLSEDQRAEFRKLAIENNQRQEV